MRVLLYTRHMTNSVYIFIGQSGSGKGTQVKLLEQTIRALHPSDTIFHLETGEKFRELIEGESFTSRKTKQYIADGVLPPAFLGVHAWSHVLIEGYTGEGYVFLDGTPRVAAEVPALLSAIEFYGWHPHIFYIEVGDTWAHDKLLARGRADDTQEEITGRIAWFYQSVLPAVDMLKSSPLVQFHRINGEQSVDAVQQEILTHLSI